MRLYFFTAADDYYKPRAEILIKSGKRYGRDIHYFHIPDGEIWNRYKVKLLASDGLPEADKYIYLDADTVMTCAGDWEADECAGVADVLYYCPDQRIIHTQGFIRNHTCVIGEGRGYDFICESWRNMGLPVWCNSGVVVLTADARMPFMACWQKWMDLIDEHCELGKIDGDEYPLMFAREEFGLPLLPPRFNGMCKSQPIYDWHVLIHADGNVSGEKRLPYVKAVEKVMEKQI